MGFRITDLLAAAFDVKIPIQLPNPSTIVNGNGNDRFIIPDKSDKQEPGYFPDVSVSNEFTTGSTQVSWLGTPVLFPMTFKGGIYKMFNHKDELEDVNMNDFVLPAATMVDFSRSKNIVSTEVSGSGGTVKELFSFGDWDIRIRGICLNDNSRNSQRLAQEQKQQLLQWENIASGIDVQGELLIEKNIYQIVIERIDLRQLEGRPGVMPFEISASSNNPVNLLISNG